MINRPWLNYDYFTFPNHRVIDYSFIIITQKKGDRYQNDKNKLRRKVPSLRMEHFPYRRGANGLTLSLTCTSLQV